MKRLLPLLAAIALLVAAPALAQYVFVDVNGDGVCNASDVLSSSVTSVDIYFDTSVNRNGDPVLCAQDATQPDSIFSYEFILRQYGGAGDVAYGVYTNLVPEFTTHFGTASDQFDFHTGYGGPGGPTGTLREGKYKVGTLMITVAPSTTPVLSPVSVSPLDANFFTAFGSPCFGADFDNTVKLGPLAGAAPGDFTDACGPGAPTPNRATTWGAIKKIYSH